MLLLLHLLLHRRRRSIVTFKPSYVFVLCTAAPMPFFIFAAGSARYKRRRFFLLLYITHRLSIHYRQSKPRALTPPPSAPSAPSPQPAPQSDVAFTITLFSVSTSCPSGFICSSPRSSGCLFGSARVGRP